MFKINKTANKKSNVSFSTFKITNISNSNKFIVSDYSPAYIKFLHKKIVKVSIKKDDPNKDLSNKYDSYGLWEKSEHMKFIEALYLYECDWMKTFIYLKSRNNRQIHSHAQKFYLRLKSFIKCEKFKRYY